MPKISCRAKQSMKGEVNCVQQDDSMDEEPRNDQESRDSLALCWSNVKQTYH